MACLISLGCLQTWLLVDIRFQQGSSRFSSFGELPVSALSSQVPETLLSPQLGLSRSKSHGLDRVLWRSIHKPYTALTGISICVEEFYSIGRPCGPCRAVFSCTRFIVLVTLVDTLRHQTAKHDRRALYRPRCRLQPVPRTTRLLQINHVHKVILTILRKLILRFCVHSFVICRSFTTIFLMGVSCRNGPGGP